MNIYTITSNNIVVQVILVFLLGEKVADYNWAVSYLRSLITLHSIKEPTSIVIDRELALIQALKRRFTLLQFLLYCWYININVLDKTKAWFPALIRVDSTLQ